MADSNSPGDVSAKEEDFPELVELRALQRQRHKKVILGLIAGGVVAIAGGLAIFAFAEGNKPQMGMGAIAIVLIGVGAIMVVRGILSAVTNIDTKPRNDLVSLPDPDED